MKYIIFPLLAYATIYSQDNSSSVSPILNQEIAKITAQQAVTSGLETVKQQIPIHANSNSNNNTTSSDFPEQCLGHAIMQGKKDIAIYLCDLKINARYEMEFPHPILNQLPGNVTFGKLPLLVGAALYNTDVNDLSIIDGLLKRGASPNQIFDVKRNNGTSQCEVLQLIAAVQKDAITNHLVQYQFEEATSQWYTTSSSGRNGPIDMSEQDYDYYYNKDKQEHK